MRATLDDTILLTERLLQLATVKRREQGEQAFVAVDLQEVVHHSCFRVLRVVKHRSGL